MRQSGEIDVLDGAYMANGSRNGDSSNGWVVVDGTGKTCASILAELTERVEADSQTFLEVIMPDVLNTYDVVVWAEERGHTILTQRKDPNGSMRILIQP